MIPRAVDSDSMPRVARQAPGGMVFHVLNRGVGRMVLFEKEGDYEAFEHVLEETLECRPMRLLAYCLMPNHWHMLLWPEADGHLAAFMHRLTITHVRHWQEHRKLVGTGHIYQGRYKSFPVQSDAHFLTVCRYVERNPLRAGLTKRAEQWRWGSLWRSKHGDAAARRMLSDWPVDRPRQWLAQLNRAETAEELEALRRSLQRGQPYGDSSWCARTAAKLGLESSFQPRGRPRKHD